MLARVFCVALLVCLVSCQDNTTDPYNGYNSYEQPLINTTTVDCGETGCEVEDDDTPTYHDWQSEYLITEGKCSESSDVVWHTGSNMCNGTSYQSCMPSWDGVIQFKDLTPDDGTAISIQFHLFGSFGCGSKDGAVQFTLNGKQTNTSLFIYQSNHNCGCGELDNYVIGPIVVNVTVWEDDYYPGDWNSLEIKEDQDVDICLCGVLVIGEYYGVGDPKDESSYHSGHGWLWVVATLFSIAVAIVIVLGIMFYYTMKRKENKEADEFDVEFAE